MRIGITGYGKMGSLIRQMAYERGHQVPLVIDPFSQAEEVTNSELPSTAENLDVIVDFSDPSVVVDNIRRYAKMKVTAVIGTTGWYDQMEEVADLVAKSESGLIWSGNFSLGVNIFFYILKTAGKVLNRFPDYDVMVHEYHHCHKAESPSGTALMIGDILIAALERKHATLTGTLDGRRQESNLHISSTRGGSIPGTHQVIFDSDVDSIVLEHTARNRKGFAEGAIMAAEWISGRRGFYNIAQMMESVIGGDEDG